AQYKSLQKFKTLDNRVLVYAGHEYTETNLRFAQTVEPNNPTIMDTLEVVKDRRSKDLSTLPSTISKEKDINLFLQAESLEQFRELRLKRDEF
ncbi:MAG TPA: hydroxyacylglutathione hydrolase C-terminal domain-containing protein, partial [Atopostipes sp.]|nr:hydroxyacylglutathione hydrolase C-terminal domain-containing protein [Atopostipes sp.]